MKRTERPFCSYGCYNVGRSKHGMYKSKLYKIWDSAKQRCVNKNHRVWERYGGRGIYMCEEWSGEQGFPTFMEDMGPRPEGTTLERIDNDGPYAPWNCKWTSRREQSNNRACTVKITFNGITKPLSLWAEELGVPEFLIRTRLKRGWSVERMLCPFRMNSHKDKEKANAFLAQKTHEKV